MDEPLEQPTPSQHPAPEVHVARRKDGADPPIRSFKDFLLQLVTITAGVLIALLLEGLVGWNNNRVLVNEARATIRREITHNKGVLDRHVDSLDKRLSDVENTLEWATERMTTGKSDRKVSVEFSASPLSSAAWETAARTGALAHMSYSDVQKYANLYSIQDLYAAHRLRTLERVTSAISLAGVEDSAAKELEALHQELLHLRGALYMEREIGRGVSEAYGKVLTE